MPHNFTLCFLMLHKVSVYTEFIECFLVLMDHCLKPMFLFPALGAGLIWLCHWRNLWSSNLSAS
jgi:hypothetical protein